MPKMIENLRERLMEEARRQTAQVGYSAMTIRSVAAACGVSVGTVYNYFPSKDALMASFMLEDWKNGLEAIHRCAQTSGNWQAVLHCMYDQLTIFLQMHSGVFCDQEAASHFGKTMGDYHGVLREQLAKPLRSLCNDDFTADFVAEAMLTWTIQQEPFDRLLSVFQKLF